MFQRTVMPYSATPPKPGHHAIVEVLVERFHVAHRRRGIEAERLDLQSVDRHHRVAVVHQMVRQREARGTKADDQHLTPGVGSRQRAADVERVPAGQQRINLEAPGQRQHVLQDRGLRLRDVDRILLLVDAGLHAVVADAVAGRRHHRVVDGDGGERAQHVPRRAQRVHLGNFLVQRTAGQRHAERRFLKRAGLAILQAGAAGILALRVAPDAVVDLIQRLLRGHSGVGQRESLALPPVVLRQAQHRDAVALDGLDRNQMHCDRPGAARGTACCRDAPHGRPRSASPRRRSASPGRAPPPRPPSPRPRHGRRRLPRSAVRQAALEVRPRARHRRSPLGRDISSPPGAARTGACRHGSGRAHGSPRRVPEPPPRCRTARRRNHPDAARAPPRVRSRPSRPAHRVRRAQPAGARAVRHPRSPDGRGRRDPAAPARRARRDRRTRSRGPVSVCRRQRRHPCGFSPSCAAT